MSIKKQLDLKDLDKLKTDMKLARNEILREGYNRGVRDAAKLAKQSLFGNKELTDQILSLLKLNA